MDDTSSPKGMTDQWDDISVEKARQIDRELDQDRKVELALRKLVMRLGAEPDEDLGLVEATYRTIDAFDDLAHRVAELEDQVDRIDRAAETALTIAEREVEPGDSVEKKQIAKTKLKYEAVERLADTSRGKASVPLTWVSDATVGVKIFYQSIKDAAEELETDWDAFEFAENEDGKKVLCIEQDDLDPAIVRATERAVERDDLTKRLISRSSEEGV